jgi:hypothetical protein
MNSVVDWLRVGALFSVAATLGCAKQRPGYDIYMVNRTHHDLYGIGVYFEGKMAADAGRLVKGGKATFGFVFLPIPEEAEVRWIDESTNRSPEPHIAASDYSAEAVARLRQWVEQGEHHSPKVKLTGIVPPNPAHMNIYFIIEEDASVTVKCLHSADLKGNIELTKGIEKLRDKGK